MAGTVNKVTLVARLGKDPEIRKTNGGSSIATLSVATSETWKDKNSGERKERTEWHRVVVFNENLADVVEKYVRKGDLVYFEGQLATRKWTDQQGIERYTTEVVVPRFGGRLTILSSRDGNNGSGGNQQQNTQQRQGSAPVGRSQADLDDDIPF